MCVLFSCCFVTFKVTAWKLPLNVTVLVYSNLEPCCDNTCATIITQFISHGFWCLQSSCILYVFTISYLFEDDSNAKWPKWNVTSRCVHFIRQPQKTAVWGSAMTHISYFFSQGYLLRIRWSIMSPMSVIGCLSVIVMQWFKYDHPFTIQTEIPVITQGFQDGGL